MFVRSASVVSKEIADAGKVRLGGFAPTLATTDAGKVRLGDGGGAWGGAEADGSGCGGFVRGGLEADPKRFRNHRMSHFSALRETGPPRTKKVA